MTAVERVAAWVDGQGKTLLLNDDGRLLEKEKPRGRYRQVQYPTTGTQALLYAASKGFDLVGTEPPVEFEPPAPQEGEHMAVANKTRSDKSKSLQYYEHAQGVIEEEGISAKAAFDITAEHFGTSPANISTAYYRIKREKSGAPHRADSAPARRWPPRSSTPVPTDLVSILPMIKAGEAAFEKMIEWVQQRERELDEREASINAREEEAKRRIQDQLSKLFD